MTRLKEARLATGMSQKAVADALHIAPPSVSNWESGKTNPSQENLKALSKLYHVSIDYLLGRDEEIAFRIAKPSNEELQSLLQEAEKLPEWQYQMAVSFMEFLIAHNDGGRIRYGELAMLEDYIAFLAQNN